MIALDEDALICDLAETYHVYDYRSLPISLVATLSVGLREDSRIKLKIIGAKTPKDTLVLALIRDHLADLIYGLGLYDNKPSHLFDDLIGDKAGGGSSGFDSPEEYLKRRAEIIGERYGD